MLLALETSCDETSAAVVHEGKVLSNVVSSQVRLHAEYGGVVPELAAREHLRNLIPVVRTAFAEACSRRREQADEKPPHFIPLSRTLSETLSKADQSQQDSDKGPQLGSWHAAPQPGGDIVELELPTAVAATQGPGLPSALMVGLKAAQTIAFVLRRPFFGIHHHEAHLYSPWIQGQPPTADFSQFQPNVSLIVSGGHTMLVHVEAELRHRVLGSTVDDAAGECFDKAGKLMGLPYPAGPHIDRLAEQGNPRAFDFPRPMLTEPNDDFSFSGLKTSIRYFLRDHPSLLDDSQGLRDLCASVQAAIVEILVAKTVRAARRLRVGCVTASGGVTCNRAFRRDLAAECRRAGLALRLAEPSLCTDNAAMIGLLAERKLAQGLEGTSLDADILPTWTLSAPAWNRQTKQTGLR
jgi:N6-L-threonylcarbamoyladenine synthase